MRSVDVILAFCLVICAWAVAESANIPAATVRMSQFVPFARMSEAPFSDELKRLLLWSITSRDGRLGAKSCVVIPLGIEERDSIYVNRKKNFDRKMESLSNEGHNAAKPQPKI